MLALAWGFVAAAVLNVIPAPQPVESGGRFDVVGRAVGEGAATPPFWREYERVSAAGDRARYDALKRSNDPYDRALAVYLAPRFAEMAFVEAALADTRFVRHGVGCIITIETIGSLAYDQIRGASEDVGRAGARYGKQGRIALARSILRSPALAHLHRAAGVELGDLLALRLNGEGCGAFEKLTAGQMGALEPAALGRLLTSIDLPWREADPRGQAARLLRGYVMACALSRSDVPDDAKRYLIEFAYARAADFEEGHRFHGVAMGTVLGRTLGAYEREQYETFVKWRPLIDELAANNPPTPRQQRAADIRRLFTAEHPMLLAEVLSFNGSELRDSAALRRSKAETLLRLVSNSQGRRMYYQDALVEARLFVLEQQAYARGLSLPDGKTMDLPAREYRELERLLGLGG